MQINEKKIGSEELSKELDQFKIDKQKQIETIDNQHLKINNMLAMEKYLRYYYYVFEEYTKKKHHKMTKKMLYFITKDFGADRQKVLDYCKNRRDIYKHAEEVNAIKSYHQVRLASDTTNESYIIAGGEYIENLYGLAWEAEILFPHILEDKMKAPCKIFNTTYLINGEKKYFPGNKEKSLERSKNEFPTIYSTQLDTTLNFTFSNYFDKEYFAFLKEVKKFDRNNINNKRIEIKFTH